MTKIKYAFVTLLLLACLPAYSGTIDFEGIADSTSLSSEYSGLSFSNSVVLTAGVSLNDFDFPPHSGTNVAVDDGGAMVILFSAPVSDLSGFFTYAAPLTLTAYASDASVLATRSSLFGSNFTSSGVAGSSPNEPISFGNLSGIASLAIAGSPSGASFVVDDLSFATPVPLPPSFYLIAGALAVLFFAIKRKPQVAAQ